MNQAFIFWWLGTEYYVHPDLQLNATQNNFQLARHPDQSATSLDLDRAFDL
jgi:hypothetical protein